MIQMLVYSLCRNTWRKNEDLKHKEKSDKDKRDYKIYFDYFLSFFLLDVRWRETKMVEIWVNFLFFISRYSFLFIIVWVFFVRSAVFSTLAWGFFHTVYKCLYNVSSKNTSHRYFKSNHSLAGRPNSLVFRVLYMDICV